MVMMAGQGELVVYIACVLLAMAGSIEAFIPRNCRQGIVASFSTPSFIHQQLPITQLSARKDDEEKEEANEPGMAEAFRQLDALESLGEDPSVAPQTSKSSGKGFQKPEIDAKTPSVEKATPEEEAQLYSEMAKELEETDEDSLYSDVLSDMGGSVSTPKSSPKIDIKSDAPPNESDTEEFMNQALEEAMKEVKLNNPSVADSVLDDKEIMKEIEAIFERGNEKLLESLEEIRKEQQDLAKESATKNAQKGVDRMEDDARRLAVAEKSMEAMLGKVSKETAEVEQAVEDLRKAQAEMEKDPLVKLRSGGIVKQGALVGFLLFAVRSIIDSVASISDESHLPAALLQGVIAMACAAYFFLS